MAKQGGKKGKVKKTKSCLPKKKCCLSRERCRRCPILMLKQGTLPEGYTVKRRKLVKAGPKTDRAPKKLPKAA